MKRVLLIVFGLLTLVILAGAGWWIFRLTASPGGPGAPPQPPQKVQTIHGETVVQVAPEVQRASGMRVEAVHAIRVQPERSAYASVLDLRPLFAVANRLAAARADRQAARAHALASKQELARMQALFKDNRNVAERKLEAARATASSDEARLQAADGTVAGIEADARQQFGTALADAAGASGRRRFAKLEQRTASLVRVTLNENKLQPAPDRITLETPDGKSLPARRLSAAPQADPALQGSAYFYLAEAALPAGLNLAARVPEQGEPLAGVLIPESGIVWYGDQRWAYVQTDQDHFARRLVTPVYTTDEGVVVDRGFKPDDAVVLRGAQLLLSEEQKPQGIATQCKDPPECDD